MRINQQLRAGQAFGQVVIAADVAQAAVAAFEEIGQLRVVQAKQRQHGGVQVVDVHLVFDGVEAEFVAGANDLAAAHAAARHPGAEAVGMMITAARALHDWRAAEFATRIACMSS